MGEIIIDFSEPPIQSLMNYVFENYRGLDDFCEIERKTIDPRGCADCHRNSYFPRGNPKYECDNFKRVYLLRYLARQFEQSNFVVKEYVLGKIEGKTDLSAVSLGGGPAPEALALLDGLSSCKGEYDLFFDNIECEASWEDIYHDISHQFANYVENIKLKTAFSCYDVTSYVLQRQYDIVFISWIFSEMGGQDSSSVLELAKNLATSPGYILVLDRCESPLVANITALVNRAQGLTLVEHDRKKHVHSIVDFPSDITDTFGPNFGCDFAFWVLQISSNEFFN